jgi:small-conductance mechanosensitive channel
MLLAISLGTAGFHALRGIVLNRLRALTSETETGLDDFAVEVISIADTVLFVFLSAYFSSRVFSVPDLLAQSIGFATGLVVAIYVVRAVNQLLDFGLSRYINQQQKQDDQYDPTILLFVKRMAKVLVWVVAFLIYIQNLGYDITALVGGLGIGGIALAFAVQNLLSDFFSSFSIYMDKPFRVGDFVKVGEDVGTVMKIGIKSTRLKTLAGPELIIPNKEITETRILNYHLMNERRVEMNFGIAYETPREKMREVPAMIEEICEGIENCRFGRAHLVNFGASTLDYDVIYFVEGDDFNLYRNIHQELSLKILERFDAAEIDMAYPTRRLIHDHTPEDPAFLDGE